MVIILIFSNPAIKTDFHILFIFALCTFAQYLTACVRVVLLRFLLGNTFLFILTLVFKEVNDIEISNLFKALTASAANCIASIKKHGHPCLRVKVSASAVPVAVAGQDANRCP